jgi:hypothetical protein
MSKKMLSIMDNTKAPREDMRYLSQPRGPATGWVFRMVTPPDLIGVPNPWDGRPFGKEIRRGLKTRHLPTARKNRDILLGDLRRFESGVGDDEVFSLASAVEYSEIIKEARAQAEDPFNVAVGFVLTDKLERAAASGTPYSRLRHFSRVAFGEGYPIAIAKEEYLKARSPDNQFGYKPLALTTVGAFETAIKHLSAFLSDNMQTACLEDVTPIIARNFRDEYLTRVVNPRSGGGLTYKTIKKNITLLKPLWDWAKEAGKIDENSPNPWLSSGGVPRNTGHSSTSREYYTSEEFCKLLDATERGDKRGDFLRLAIATGCRADEIAALKIEDVVAGAKGFHLRGGKTSNAQRYVPVVSAARDVLKARVATNGLSGRVVPRVVH